MSTNKSCTNCPGATDHDAAHCPLFLLRERFRLNEELPPKWFALVLQELDVFIASQRTAGMQSSLEPQFATGGVVSELLAAIKQFGSEKWTEGGGFADKDLSDVRAAWDDVYRLVQILAQSSPIQTCTRPDCGRFYDHSAKRWADNACAADQAPAGWQYRVIAKDGRVLFQNLNDGWHDCGESSARGYQTNPLRDGYSYEVRPLYAAPVAQAGQAQGDEPT